MLEAVLGKEEAGFMKSIPVARGVVVTSRFGVLLILGYS